MNRAELYRAVKPARYREAIADWTSALQYAPSNAKFLNGGAMNYHAMGQTNLAIADLNAAIKAAPDLAIPYCNMGVIYGDFGRRDEEKRWYAKCYSLDLAEKTSYDGQSNWRDAYLAWQRYLASTIPAGGASRHSCDAYHGAAQSACQHGNMDSPQELRRQGKGDGIETRGLPNLMFVAERK